MGCFSKFIFGSFSIVTILIVAVVLYFTFNVVELSEFPGINMQQTSDLWMEKYKLADTKLIINNFNNTSVAILDDEGLLNVTGWCKANKLNAKKKRVYPVLWGFKKLSYMRFKHIDSYNYDIEEYSLRITGYATGLHKYILGMYRVEFFNWKTKEYFEHESHVLPHIDAYTFRDNTINYRKIHYKRGGLETTLQFGKDSINWLALIEIKLHELKLNLDLKVELMEGISHIDTFDGKDRSYWQKRYGNANNMIMKGNWRFRHKAKRIDIDSEFGTKPSMFHWQIKGMFPYKPMVYLRAHFQTKNLDKEEANPQEHIHFTYAIEGDTRPDSEDLVQYIAIGSKTYKLEPTLHDLEFADRPLTKEVNFYTKDEGQYDGRKVVLKFTPYYNAKKIDMGNPAMYNKGYLVYGHWNGFIVDNKGKKFRVKSAKGTVNYGTLKF